jgi:chemotaxis protein histidine kinase CheA
MNTPEPRLNKLPFILTDVGCLAATALIGLFVKDPFAPLPLILCVTLVIAGGIALLIPFFADYAADCREATARLSNELEEQISRVQAAGESLTRSAAQIKAIEEAVHKSARDAETLPYRMQEKLAEFNEALAEKETEDREALELELEELRSVNSGNLKAVADKIQKATVDWTALEASTRKQLVLAQEAAAKIDALLKHALARIESPPATAAAPAVAAPAPAEERKSAPIPPVENPAPPETPLPVAPEAAAGPVEPAPGSEAAKARKPRPPRKAKPEDILHAMSGSPAAAEPVKAVSSAHAQTDDSDASADPSTKAESSSSSDGATRLLTTAYIGIGNKLYIRGDGPGLSWDKGVPMQFVSIGKWGWSTHDAAGPVRVKLYKNDETAALTGELTLEPSRHTEITALF